MSNPFLIGGTRPWTRITNAARAVSTIILGRGELALTETGRLVAGNGAAALKDLSPFLTAAEAAAQYVTWDGTYLRLGTVVIPIIGDAVVATASNGGILTLSGSGVTEQGGIISLTGSNVTEQNGVITIT